jgi:hypothetical protein
VAERLYGENKPSYGVTERRDGWIELRVYHGNRSMRQVLQEHIDDPSFFLRRYHAYSRSGTRAESWLAKVTADYRSHFQRNLVKIVLSPSTLAPAMAAPPADVLPDDSPEKRSLSMRTPGLRGQVTPEEACRVIHEALESLPLLASPADVPFGDGLYFFYEEGEASEHAPNGRIVRVGNHPRKQGGLVPRLRMHYSGNKNSSVFRKSLGGALLRRDNPGDPCLSPAPGKGHWEKQDAKTCPRCKPTEAMVSDLLRERFRFRCVRVPDLAERNGLEALLIATLAACSVCRPSPSWLGLHAYSENVRASGLWNSQYVGDATIDQRDLDRFQDLVSSSLERFGRLKKNM